MLLRLYWLWRLAEQEPFPEQMLMGKLLVVVLVVVGLLGLINMVIIGIIE